MLLNEYTIDKAHSIKGWYDYINLNPILYYIDTFHKANNIIGDICEIGVYHGKFFLALCCLKQENETCLAIDSFGTNPETDAIYGDGEENRIIFKNNYENLFKDPVENILLQKNSNALDPDKIKRYTKNPIRFFSIDGDRSVAGVYNSMVLAKFTLSNYGVIIVDDYFSLNWPEVQIGVDLFLKDNQNISIISTNFNKTFLTHTVNKEIMKSVIQPKVHIS